MRAYYLLPGVGTNVCTTTTLLLFDLHHHTQMLTDADGRCSGAAYLPASAPCLPPSVPCLPSRAGAAWLLPVETRKDDDFFALCGRKAACWRTLFIRLLYLLFSVQENPSPSRVPLPSPLLCEPCLTLCLLSAPRGLHLYISSEHLLSFRLQCCWWYCPHTQWRPTWPVLYLEGLSGEISWVRAFQLGCKDPSTDTPVKRKMEDYLLENEVGRLVLFLSISSLFFSEAWDVEACHADTCFH